MRVVIADDVMLVREGIARLLGDAGIEVVAQTSDADSLMREVSSKIPDIAVIDIRMPPTHTDEGLVAAKTIRAEHPGIGVLVLSQYIEPSYAMRLIEDQPEKVGYLLKDCDMLDILAAIRSAAMGHAPLDPRVAGALLRSASS